MKHAYMIWSALLIVVGCMSQPEPDSSSSALTETEELAPRARSCSCSCWNDTKYVGSVVFEYSAADPKCESGNGQRCKVTGSDGVVRVGRTKDCDVLIDDTEAEFEEDL